MVVLGAGAAVGGVIVAVGGLAGDPERVTQMWVGAELTNEGGTPIVEVIDYDFGLAFDKHGIFRDIPGLSVESPVTVQSDSAPAGIAARTPIFTTGARGLPAEDRRPEHHDHRPAPLPDRLLAPAPRAAPGQRRHPELGRGRHRVGGAHRSRRGPRRRALGVRRREVQHGRAKARAAAARCGRWSRATSSRSWTTSTPATVSPSPPREASRSARRRCCPRHQCRRPRTPGPGSRSRRSPR